MSESIVFALIGLCTIIALALGYVVSHLRSRNQIDELRQKYSDLNIKLDQERTSATEKIASIEKMRGGIQQTLSNFGSHDKADETLENIGQPGFVQSLLKPLQITLQNADQQIRRIERESERAQQLVNQQLEMLKAPQQLGRGSAKEIAAVLGNAETRHHWGINTLKRLLELTYMTDHCRSNPANEGAKPAPCIVETPNGKLIAIDTHSPLEAYANVCEAPDPSVRTWHIETVARKLRERILEIGSHTYQSQFQEPPELTILLVINDHYLAISLENDPDLLQDAAKQNIVLATPTDLLNLLQTFSFGWRQQAFSSDAQKLRTTGINLYKRFGTFTKLLEQVGNQLSGVLISYNKAVKYFETPESSADTEATTSEDDNTKPRKSA
ncbi:MAG: DNA recombination protein RmuC [Gammaproteobacteria bacterium]|nr:DNA recombination protein RmuC [Gammaproteobacteria bacterium]